MQPLKGNLQKCDGLDSGHIEALAAANVLASYQVVGAHHVALRLGKAGAVALIGIARKLRLLAAHKPSNLVLARLTAMRTGHGMRALLGLFVEKIAFFHAGSPPGLAANGFGAVILAVLLQSKVLHNRCCGAVVSLRQGSAMGKAKKRVFSVVKAVKLNARDRVGPVPPERVIPDPKQKAAARPKHKKTLADLLSSGDEASRD